MCTVAYNAPPRWPHTSLSCPVSSTHWGLVSQLRPRLTLATCALAQRRFSVAHRQRKRLPWRPRFMSQPRRRMMSTERVRNPVRGSSHPRLPTTPTLVLPAQPLLPRAPLTWHFPSKHLRWCGVEVGDSTPHMLEAWEQTQPQRHQTRPTHKLRGASGIAPHRAQCGQPLRLPVARHRSNSQPQAARTLSRTIRSLA